jgi:hypothetical protein
MIKQKIINEIIPPMDYKHRNGFNNIPLINKLTKHEKELLVSALIQKLNEEIENKFPDTLIIETLAYLKAKSSIETLTKLLNNIKDFDIKLIIACSIYEINGDIKMIEIAINTVKQIDNKNNAYYIYSLSSAFYYLAKFKHEKTLKLIKVYLTHPEYLISYNAKEAIGER